MFEMIFSRYFFHLLHDGDLRVHWMTASSSGPFLYSVSAAAATTVGVGEAYLFQSPLGLAPLHTGCDERYYTPKSLYPHFIIICAINETTLFSDKAVPISASLPHPVFLRRYTRHVRARRARVGRTRSCVKAALLFHRHHG